MQELKSNNKNTNKSSINNDNSKKGKSTNNSDKRAYLLVVKGLGFRLQGLRLLARVKGLYREPQTGNFKNIVGT